MLRFRNYQQMLVTHTSFMRLNGHIARHKAIRLDIWLLRKFARKGPEPANTAEEA